MSLVIWQVNIFSYKNQHVSIAMNLVINKRLCRDYRRLNEKVIRDNCPGLQKGGHGYDSGFKERIFSCIVY